MKAAISTNIFDFKELRVKDCLYVDKTKYIYNLVKDPSDKFFFCARPRRFGKSLFCSTLEYLFEGEKELFDGLYIASTDYDFKTYPVLHFDFSKLKASNKKDFLFGFKMIISNEAKKAGYETIDAKPSFMLSSLLESIKEEVVIIIDEFDSPVISNLENKRLSKEVESEFSAFYTMIKSYTSKIRFLFITGITKLSNMSIFSALNNLIDISFLAQYDAAFGYTQEELEYYFSSDIEEYIASSNIERNNFLSDVKSYYDGYRFSSFSDTKVYNPVAIGMFFKFKNGFQNYWEGTAISFLAVTLAKNYDLLTLVEENPTVSTSAFSAFDAFMLSDRTLSVRSIYALLYYTGYLTISTASEKTLTLTFPNKEVASSFTSTLLGLYAPKAIALESITEKGALSALEGRTKDFLINLQDYYEQFPYDLFSRYEDGYQIVFHAFFLPMREAITESHEHRGRADSVIVGEKHIYICELKVDDAAEKAIEQIKEKKYYRKYLKRGATVHLLGISYSSKAKERGIKSYIEEIVDDSEAFSRHSGLIEFSYGK